MPDAMTGHATDHPILAEGAARRPRRNAFPLSDRLGESRKTSKRDYVRVNPIPDAATAWAAINAGMTDYNEVTSTQPARLSLTQRISQNHLSTRRAFGLIGATPVRLSTE